MKKFITWLISVDGLSWTTTLIVVAQSFHYYAFFLSFGLFDNIINHVYSLFLTIVLSLPLLVFTTKLGNIPIKFGDKNNSIEREELIDKYTEGVNLYMYTDIVINIYTWYTTLDVFFNFQWIYLPKYIVATLIAIILPITLKKFAGEIRLK
jgi:hypothetical protein